MQLNESIYNLEGLLGRNSRNSFDSINSKKLKIQQIFENNKNWIQDKLSLDKQYFEKLAEGQHPGFLYIGCSDSRVAAEDMMGLQPGEVFVHRNIANMVPNYDLNTMSVIDYAVSHLKVRHVIVCGHYGCGGIKAAMSSTNLGILNPHLRNIRDVYRLHQQELDKTQNEDQRYNRLVELNVQEQCLNVLEKEPVQKAYRAGELEIHGWVFDMKTGKTINLNLDLEALTDNLKNIYTID